MPKARLHTPSGAPRAPSRRSGGGPAHAPDHPLSDHSSVSIGQPLQLQDPHESSSRSATTAATLEGSNRRLSAPALALAASPDSSWLVLVKGHGLSQPEFAQLAPPAAPLRDCRSEQRVGSRAAKESRV